MVRTDSPVVWVCWGGVLTLLVHLYDLNDRRDCINAACSSLVCCYWINSTEVFTQYQVPILAGVG